MTLAPFPTATHGDLDCPDVEVMLAEATTEVTRLRTELAHTQGLLAERDHRIQMLTAVAAETASKHAHTAGELDDLRAQVKFLSEELTAAENAAIPEGTVVAAALPRADLMTRYRAISRVTRGPLPPTVLAAVDAEADLIREAMTRAGQDALTATLRRAVRRRRDAARRTGRTR